MGGMKLLPLIPLIALAYTSAATAEVTWIEAGGRYELTGAMLFKLRDELPDDLEDKLKAIRNEVFGDEAGLRAALQQAGADAAWVARLLDVAAVPGSSFGVEARGLGMTTLYVVGPEPVPDDNAFTAQSWLATLPAAADNMIGARMDEDCLDVADGNVTLLSLCEPDAGEDGTAVIVRTPATHVVGLGQEFQAPGDTTAERVGFVRHGHNVMEGFNGGANGNTLFPIAYFDHPQRDFALILDNRYQQEWDLEDPGNYRLRVWDGDFRLHVLTGTNFADIRRRFMAMSGHPPVPPKAMFGLWLSEYGFQSWDEVEEKLASLKANDFSVSGVVLDLFWFGGVDSSRTSRMGSLRWDETAFPDPAGKIAELEARGLGVMLIEESYVSAGLPEFAALAAEGALAHDANGEPLLVNPNGNWWGTGGMIDWTSESARTFWHDFRRQALIGDGIMGHWTDLGEPEMTNPDFVYGDGLTGAQVHNSYNLLWLKGIADGYRRSTPAKRAFMMSRSGGMGMQALGAAMWSGDTGSDFGSLAAQMPQQTHMMWSGLDYYGSDVGGFHRGALGIYEGEQDELMDELYTQWLAYSALFEVPVRPHTENLCNCKETAPDRIGDLASNRGNLKLRYRLAPYYYSLAHKAWLEGEPVFPPLDYWFPDDPEAKGLGHVKMIGSELISAAVAAPAQTSVELYLPKGSWFELHSGRRIDSAGEPITWLLNDSGLFRLPLFARDGAILPLSVEGLGNVLQVIGTGANRFDWYDDDGVSTAYQRGDYEHVAVAVEGNAVRLTRERGETLSPRSLIWSQLGGPVNKVLVNRVLTRFEETPEGITVPLPAFDEELRIEIVR
jgi:alpha-glucosidase (family GH31 glycosyl hydrolase)